MVLGVAAHPDDLEFYAAGTIAKWAEQGSEIHYLILTDGSKGTANRALPPEELLKLRHKEQQKAAKIIGVKKVEFLDYPDGELKNTPDLQRDIARMIRKVKPDVIVTIDPSMIYCAEYAEGAGFVNHPDHRAAGQATLDAAYPLARDHLSFPELLEQGFEPHETPTILLVNFERHNYFVDIEKSQQKKMAALDAYSSQEPDKKILQNLAESMGAKYGCKCAEAFMRIEVR